MALGYTGLGEEERAAACYGAVIELDAVHLGATLHQRLLTAGA